MGLFLTQAGRRGQARCRRRSEGCTAHERPAPRSARGGAPAYAGPQLPSRGNNDCGCAQRRLLRRSRRSEHRVRQSRSTPSSAASCNAGGARLAQLRNPTAVAELREGETVLDLGSGEGIDVLLSQAGGEQGRPRGLDMTGEMLASRARRRGSRRRNMIFLKGVIEEVRCPPSRSTVISNCVSTSRPTRQRMVPRSPGCSGPAGRSGSATSSPKTNTRQARRLRATSAARASRMKCR